jgi:hypothetical protein
MSTGNKPTVQQAAKQGNPQAIAILLNRQLQPKGITAKISVKASCLQIMLEAATVPNQKGLVTALKKWIDTLAIDSIQGVQIYAKRTGEDIPAWNDSFEMVRQVEDPKILDSPTVATETSKNDSTVDSTVEESAVPELDSYQEAGSKLLQKRIEQSLTDQRITVNVETVDKILYIKLTPDKSSENLNYYLLWMQISNQLVPDTLKGFSQVIATVTFEGDSKSSWQKVSSIDVAGNLTITKLENKNSSKKEVKIPYKTIGVGVIGVALISSGVVLFNHFSSIRKIPSVVGISIDEAKNSLQKQDLKYETIEIEAGNLLPDQVISQNPLPSTNSTKGSIVKLTVSKLPKLPKLINISLKDAKKILTDLKLAPQVVEFKTTEDFESGRVMSQTPLPDTPIKEGEKVQLVIAKAPVYKIKGTFTLYDSDIEFYSDRLNNETLTVYNVLLLSEKLSKQQMRAINCYGKGGYKDISSGMTVKVQDGKQNILALGKTEVGYSDGTAFGCSLEFEVNDVPKSDFYVITVGNRGGINYSFDEMNKRDWKVYVSLGR